jgi:glycine betaine/proline transport system substrate-binding protein
MRSTGIAAAGGMLLGLAAATIPPAGAAEPAGCQTVRLADIGFVDVTATTALTSLILKDLGYTPKISLLTVPVTYQSLRDKTVDVFLGNWMPGMEADRKPFTDDKSVDVLGANLEGAKFTLAVPQYTYDAGLRDVGDIQKFGKELNNRIYGIEPGNDGNRHILDLIRNPRWGLEKFQLVEGSEQAMLAEVAKDVRGKRPIVFLGWEPHPMNRTFKIAYLSGGDDIFGPNFGGASAYTNVRAGYVAECPNVGKLLTNLKFSLAAEDAMMDSILNKKMDPARAVLVWLRANKSVLKDWLDGVTTFDGKPGLPAVQGKL